MSVSYMTHEGYEKLKSELDELKTKGRENVAKAIAEAREKGDLSENAEYDAAKNAQGMLEMKINELEKVFANSRIIDESQLDTSKVTVLTNVTIQNVNNGAEVTYKLVAEAEANLKEKKISVNSPIGQGLLGKTVGDLAQIQTPAGFLAFLDISPLVKGHTLVIPKTETDYIFDIEDRELGEMMVFTKKVAHAIKSAIQCTKVGVSVIGLEVAHAHIHLIPMNRVDEMNFSREKLVLTSDELTYISGIIRAKL